MLCRLHTVYKIIHCVELHTLCNITQSVSNHTVKLSIFCVTSGKIYTGQKIFTPKNTQQNPKSSEICGFSRSIWKILHLTELFYTGTARGARDKYQVCAIVITDHIIYHLYYFIVCYLWCVTLISQDTGRWANYADDDDNDNGHDDYDDDDNDYDDEEGYDDCNDFSYHQLGCM